MTKQLKTLAFGLDGARGGWVAAVLRGASVKPEDEGSWTAELAPLKAIEDIQELRGGGGRRLKIAVDIPIGLPDRAELRSCDREARKRLGKLRSSVFAPPPRPILDAESFADIQAWVEKVRSTEPSAKGISKQSFALFPKVREVDEWLCGDTARNKRLFECHPELAFLHLNKGQPLPSKRSPAGAVQRLRLVSKKFGGAEQRLRHFVSPGVDLSDALDAYACLSVALRHRQDESEELGGGECDALGVPMRMVT